MPKMNCRGLHMYYELEGSGTPLVLIHGLSGDHFGWAMQAPAFTAGGYQCLLFDNRDVGQTDESPTGYNIREFADDTVALMSHLGIASAHIVGASMGGMIAQEMAINYPERVSSLTLVCTAPAVDPFISHIVRSWMVIRPRCSSEDYSRLSSRGSLPTGFLSSKGRCRLSCRWFVTTHSRRLSMAFGVSARQCSPTMREIALRPSRARSM